MDLHDDPAAGRELLAEAGRTHRLRAARRPRAQPRRAVEAVVVAQPRSAEAGPALALDAGVHRLGVGHHVRRHREQDDVVHDFGVAGLHEGAGEVRVLGQVRVEQEAPVVVGARAVGRGRGVRRGHRQCHPLLALTQRLRLGRLDLVAVPVLVPLVGGLVARALARLGRGVGGERGGRADRHAVGVAGVVVGPARGERQRQDRRGRRGDEAGQPGGHVIALPASTCRWVWNTV